MRSDRPTLSEACRGFTPRHAFSCLAGVSLRKAVAVLMAAAIAFPAVAEPIAAELVAPRSQPAGKTAVPMPSRSVLDPDYAPQMMSPGPFSDVSASPADANATVRIGIQQTTAVNVLQPGDGGFLDRTKDRIREAFGSRRGEFMTLTRGELAEAIRNGDVDFVIGQSDFIAQAQMENNLRLIASFWPVEARDVNSVASAVFFTKAQSLDVQSLAQLGDHAVAAISPDSFPGYLVPLYELSRRGYAPGYLQELYFTGPPYENVTRDVLSGKAAAGILPACVLEALDRQKKISLSDFRIINPRRETELQCSHSTDVFPSLTVASLQKTDGNTQKTMATALYLMPHTGKEAQWALPASMQSVLDVFYRLKIGPYQYLAQWSIQRFVKENAAEVAVALIFILMVVSYAAVLQMMVRRKTLALRKSMQERQRYEQEIAASREHIAAIERTGIIGQMSSMIAHELKQPLGAINNFGNGLLRRLHRGPVDPKVLEGALEEIVGQGTRASEIVDRVRGYAKHPDPVMQVLDMKPVLEKAAKEFHHIYPDAPPITLACLPYSWAEVDAWEIQLAVLNLLKNAWEAVPIPGGKISFSVIPENSGIRIDIRDNGCGISKEQQAAIFQPFFTTKESGTGLGLAVSKQIAQAHSGDITLESTPGQGTVFHIFLG